MKENRKWAKYFDVDEVLTLKETLSQNLIAEKTYLKWACEEYQLPRLDSNYFESHQFENWNKFKGLMEWNETLVPLTEWEGSLYVGCLEPQTQPSTQKVVFILAPSKDLENVWKKYNSPSVQKESSVNQVVSSKTPEEILSSEKENNIQEKPSEKSQPEIQKVAQPEVQPKIQPEIQPEVQKETQSKLQEKTQSEEVSLKPNKQEEKVSLKMDTKEEAPLKLSQDETPQAKPETPKPEESQEKVSLQMDTKEEAPLKLSQEETPQAKSEAPKPEESQEKVGLQMDTKEEAPLKLSQEETPQAKPEASKSETPKQDESQEKVGLQMDTKEDAPLKLSQDEAPQVNTKQEPSEKQEDNSQKNSDNVVSLNLKNEQEKQAQSQETNQKPLQEDSEDDLMVEESKGGVVNKVSNLVFRLFVSDPREKQALAQKKKELKVQKEKEKELKKKLKAQKKLKPQKSQPKPQEKVSAQNEDDDIKIEEGTDDIKIEKSNEVKMADSDDMKLTETKMEASEDIKPEKDNEVKMEDSENVKLEENSGTQMAKMSEISSEKTSSGFILKETEPLDKSEDSSELKKPLKFTPLDQQTQMVPIKNNQSPIRSILEESKKHVCSYVLFRYLNNKFIPIKWSHNLKPKKNKPVSLKYSSFFRVSSHSKQSYFGFVPPVHGNQKFFENWNFESLPDQIAFVPILGEDKKILGGYLGVLKETDTSLEYLKEVEDSVKPLVDYFQNKKDAQKLAA